ncbi:pirin family protein [Halocola ammonii]
MKVISHPAESRGHANHGWLNSHHSFSFANFYDPEKIHFGALRVLNDDTVAPGKGFGRHPHDNMEIISIPLSGDLEHQDSMGNKGVIREGDVQVMSAGTGVQHSEFNANQDKEVKFLQIWVFPDKKNVEPRYDQMSLDKDDRLNQWQQIISPFEDDPGLWVHQQTWFYLAKLEAGKSLDYKLHKPTDGVYLFLIEGELKVGEKVLGKRDAIGMWELDNFYVEATSDAEILLMEVPMQF